MIEAAGNRNIATGLLKGRVMSSRQSIEHGEFDLTFHSQAAKKEVLELVGHYVFFAYLSQNVIKS